MTLIPQLATLESIGLIEPAQLDADDLEYLFRHALIQDAAYQSLLKRDRRDLHLAVGNVLEKLYAEQLDEIAPRLASHLEEGGDDVRAIRYYVMAGDTAFSLYANAEAAMHYGRALDIATRLPELAAEIPLKHLFTRRGRAMELVGNYVNALVNYEEMDDFAEQVNDRQLRLAALILKATVYSAPTALHDPVRGKTLSEQALEAARNQADPQSEAKAYWNLMLLHKFGGELQQALICGEQALDLARKHNLREQAAYILNDIFPLYAASGQAQHAETVLREALSLWRELGIHNMQADCLASLSSMYAIMGQRDRALSIAAEAWEISSRIHNTWNQAYSLYPLVTVYLHRGEISQAVDTAVRCIRLGEQAAFAPALVQTRAELALVYVLVGAYNLGLQAARQSRDAARVFLPAWQELAMTMEAYILLKQGHIEAAESVLIEIESLPSAGNIGGSRIFTLPLALRELAISRNDLERALALSNSMVEAVESLGVGSYLDITLHFRGEVLWLLGRVDEAESDLNKARVTSETTGSRIVLWQTRYLLGEIAAQRGEANTAREHWESARTVITYITDHMDDEEIRADFLNLPQVRGVLEKVGLEN